MHLLLTYLPLIIGDLIPVKCEVWKLLLLLQSIVLICLCKSVSKDISEYLAVIVSEHHELYKSLFHKLLKPKFHFMLHYPKSLLMTGPLSLNWSYRFESKHSQLKQYANVCRSRINIEKSISLRHQLILSHTLLAGYKIEEPSMGKGNVSSEGEYCAEYLDNFNYRLRIGSIVFIEFDSELPLFGKVSQIIASKNSPISLVLEVLNTIGFHSHYNSYEIKELPQPKVIICMFKDEHAPLIKINLKNKFLTMFNYFQA